MVQGALSTSKGLYQSALGQQELPASVTKTPFGNVITSGGFYTGSKIATPVVSNSASGTGSFTVGKGSYATNYTGTGGLNSGVSSILASGAQGQAAASPATTASTAGWKSDALEALTASLNDKQAAVESAKNAVNQSESRITNAQTDYNAARQAAAKITNYADSVSSTIDKLNPYIDLIRGNGTAFSGLADALLAGDSSVGGVAGKYLASVDDAADALATLNPETYAARAKADVQAQYDNAQGQMQREMARRGVSLGSGAAATLQSQLKRALATAAASAATRGYQQGIQDRADAAVKKAGLYQGVLGAAEEAKKSSTEDFATAAGIVEKQAGLFSTSAELMQQQSHAFVEIGGAEVDLGELDLKNESLVQGAISAATDAQQAMADFYLNAEKLSEAEREAFASKKTTEVSRDKDGNYTRTTSTTSVTPGASFDLSFYS